MATSPAGVSVQITSPSPSNGRMTRFSGSPTQLNKEAAHRRVRCKRLLCCVKRKTFCIPLVCRASLTSIHDRPLKERLRDFDNLISRALTHLILRLVDRLELHVNFDVRAITVNVTPPRPR